MIIILFYSQLHNIEFFLREQEKQLKKCCETTKKRNETLINLIQSNFMRAEFHDISIW